MRFWQSGNLTGATLAIRSWREYITLQFNTMTDER